MHVYDSFYDEIPHTEISKLLTYMDSKDSSAIDNSINGFYFNN